MVERFAFSKKVNGSMPLSFKGYIASSFKVMINKRNNFFFTSQYVSSNLFKNIALKLNSIKTLFPLNLPRINRNYLFAFLDSHVIHYPTPITLTYAWSFGSLAGICLVIQMISGIFLAMHYTPNIELAFSSVEYIMRDSAGYSVLFHFFVLLNEFYKSFSNFI